MRPAMLTLIVPVAVAACGSTSSSSQSASSSQASSSASSTSSSAVLQTAGSPALGTILTDSRGMTVYFFLPERGGVVACTGQCAQVWPAVTVPAGAPAGAGAGITGKLGTVARADGSQQLTYNGWPVHTYSADRQAGDTLGQGFMGKWFVLTPGTAPDATGTAGTAAAPATPVPPGTPVPPPVAAPPPRAAPPPPPVVSGIPQGNGGDHDADNNGAPSDGDGPV